MGPLILLLKSCFKKSEPSSVADIIQKLDLETFPNLEKTWLSRSARLDQTDGAGWGVGGRGRQVSRLGQYLAFSMVRNDHELQFCPLVSSLSFS